LLVVQSDLSLKQAVGAAPAGPSAGAQGSTTLKLNLSVYSKQAAASAPQPPTPARS